MIYFLKLIRYQNLLIIAATQYLMRYFIIKPFLDFAFDRFSLQLNEFHFFLLVLTTVLIAAAGYIINDYFDIKTDRINKPEDVVIDKVISRRSAIALHTVMNTTGIFIGIYLSWYVGVLPLSLIFLLCSGLLWFYSTTYKRQLLIGNIVVSFMIAGVPLLVAIYEIPLLNKAYGTIMLLNQVSFNYIFYWIAGFSFFAFLTNLIREIVKDTEDFEGDNAYGMNTIPIYFGIKYTKIIISFLIIVSIISIALLMKYIVFSGESIDYLTAVYFTLFIILPYIILFFWIKKAKKKEDYHRASTLLKFIMLTGIMYAFVVRYIVTYQIK